MIQSFDCKVLGGGIGTAVYDDNFQYVKAYRYILGTPGAADMDSYALGDRGYCDYFLSDDRLLFFGARNPWKEGGDKYLLTIGDLDLSWTVGPGQHGYNVDCGRVNHYEVGSVAELIIMKWVSFMKREETKSLLDMVANAWPR